MFAWKKAIPFSDAELIKDRVIEVARRLGPDKNKYKGMSFPKRTDTNRQHELARNVTN